MDIRSASVDTDPYADLLTVEQAAAFLHLSPASIRLYIREGTLKAFRVAGRRKVRILRTELLALLQPAIPETVASPANSSTPVPVRRGERLLPQVRILRMEGER